MQGCKSLFLFVKMSNYQLHSSTGLTQVKAQTSSYPLGSVANSSSNPAADCTGARQV